MENGMNEPLTTEQKFSRAAEVVRRVAAAEGYRVTYCTRAGIGAKIGKSRRELQILCNPESPYSLSPFGSRGLDAELLRERIVDALVAEGLLQ